MVLHGKGIRGSSDVNYAVFFLLLTLERPLNRATVVEALT